MFDEVHKKPDWSAEPRCVVEARADGQVLLVVGSARMEMCRQSRESLAGHYMPLRRKR